MISDGSGSCRVDSAGLLFFVMVFSTYFYLIQRVRSGDTPVQQYGPDYADF